MLVSLGDARFGDLIFFRPTNVVGRVICAVDGGAFSHVAVYLEKRHGRHHFVEALIDGGIVYSLLDEELSNYVVARPPGAVSRSKSTLVALVGKRRYDYWRLARVLAFYALGLKLPSDESARFVCSELANWTWGGSLADGDLVTPRTVHEAATRI